VKGDAQHIHAFAQVMSRASQGGGEVGACLRLARAHKGSGKHGGCDGGFHDAFLWMYLLQFKLMMHLKLF
jgi:hypothetical protein